MARMKKEDFYQMMTDHMVKAIDNGANSWVKCWKGSDSAENGYEPRNPMTMAKGKAYRGSNVFWLWMVQSAMGYDDNRWGTYKSVRDHAIKYAKQQGRTIEERPRSNGKGTYLWDVDNDCVFKCGVRKGEKGTKVAYWKMIKIPEVQDDGSIKEKMIPYFKPSTVFNYEQCDGLPAYEKKEKGHVWNDEIDQLSENFFAHQNIRLNFGGDRAFYSPSADRIQMPHKENFDGENQFYSTLYHEMAHSTGHASRLNRKGIVGHTRFGSDSYSFEELVAEFTAVFVMGRMGRSEINDDVFMNSAAYLRGWAKAFRKNPDWVCKATAKAQAACDFIMKHKELSSLSNVA